MCYLGSIYFRALYRGKYKFDKSQDKHIILPLYFLFIETSYTAGRYL